MISNGFCDVRCCCLNQSRSRYSVIASDVMAVCDIVFTVLRFGDDGLPCTRHYEDNPPFYQVAFIQTHTVMRFHNLVVYRTAIFGRLIDNPPCFFVAGQSEGNLYIIIHLKNRNPGRGNGEDNLCSFSRVNCVIGDPVRLYFLE